MSLAVKEILNIGCRQLEECGIADAAIDSKLLYCHLMNITTTQLLLEYQQILSDALCDEYFKLLDIRSSGGETLEYSSFNSGETKLIRCTHVGKPR